MNTICRRGLDQFEGQYIGSEGWFKLDINYLKTTFPKSHSEFYKTLFGKNMKDKDMEVYKMFIVPFDK